MRNLLLAVLLLTSLQLSGKPIDSCLYYRRKVDTLNHKLYIANKQITTVKFYIKLCQKRPANKKFFWSWITTRAIK